MRLRRLALALALALGASACRGAAPARARRDVVTVPGGVVELRAGFVPLPGGPAGGGRPAAAAPAGGAAPWSFAGVQPPPRRVRVAPFAIDRTEVTRARYRRFLEETGYRPPHVDEDWAGEGGPWGRFNWDGLEPPPGTDDHPVVLVSWYDAAEFCRWAGGRLPTEAEWQLAALGPAPGRRFPWGDAWRPALLNHGSREPPFTDASDGWATTSPVGAYPGGASPYGLLDAFGNAWEWTADWRRDDPAGTPPGAPGLYKVVRGGSYFFDFAVNPEGERSQFLPEIRRKTTGFRCAY